MADKAAAQPTPPKRLTPKPAPPKSQSDEKRTFEPKYNWMDKTRQWGVRVKPGKAGLRLGT